MSLLVDLVTNSLEPEYAWAVARRASRPSSTSASPPAPASVGAASGPAPAADSMGPQEGVGGEGVGGEGVRRRWASRLQVAVGIAALGLLLGLGAHHARSVAPTANRAHEKLVAQVRALTDSVDGLATSAAHLQTDSDKLRAAALGTDATDATDAAARLAAARQATGATAVVGPGVHLVIDDAPVAAGQTADPAARVSDRDLQRVVNGLWEAGAEAVSIGDVRLTARSSIRTAGEAVLVDFRPVELPYSIDAIGNPATLATAFSTSKAAADMRVLSRSYGIRFSVVQSPSLRLPAAADLGLHLARPMTSGEPLPSTGP